MTNIKLSREVLIKKTIERIDKSNIQFIVVFGSALTDKFNDESDIDLGIMFKSNVDFLEERRQIMLKFVDFTNHDLDIIVLNTSDIIITMQVFANGNVVYCTDKYEFNLLKARKLCEYADFKQSRQWLEKNFLKQRVYAGS